MTQVREHEPVIELAARPGHRSGYRRVLAPWHRAVSAWRRMRRLRRAVRELSSIGVYRLTDLGIPPGQIPEFAEALLARELEAETLASFPVPPSTPRPDAAHHRGAA